MYHAYGIPMNSDCAFPMVETIGYNMIPCLTAFLAVRTQFTVVETITCPENREATIWNHIIALQNVVPLGTIKYCSVGF